MACGLTMQFLVLPPGAGRIGRRIQMKITKDAELALDGLRAADAHAPAGTAELAGRQAHSTRFVTCGSDRLPRGREFGQSDSDQRSEGLRQPRR